MIVDDAHMLLQRPSQTALWHPRRTADFISSIQENGAGQFFVSRYPCRKKLKFLAYRDELSSIIGPYRPLGSAEHMRYRSVRIFAKSSPHLLNASYNAD